MFEDENDKKKPKPIKKMTKVRLKNIALYYLERFETSANNLKTVLKRRIDKYAYKQPEFDKKEAYEWVEQLLEEFERLGYVDDERFANFKIKSYLSSGKSASYIRGNLKQKGISGDVIDAILAEQEYDPLDTAVKFARKKKLGPFRPDEESREENKQKDFATLMRAGFEYGIIIQVLKVDEEF